ncbi:MAG: hypothetical protein V4556_12350 [Bacteroidota bacterium]
MIIREIDTIRKEVLPKIKIFFDSIETQFNYRKKNYSKFRMLNTLTSIFLLFLIFNIIPILPYFFGTATSITNQKIIINKLSIPLDNFFVRWIVFSLIAGILYALIRPIDKFFDKKEDKYSINRKHLPFAYLYKAIKELEIFLVNDRKEHTDISFSYLKKYVKRSFLYDTLDAAEKSIDIYLPETLQEFKKNFTWIKYSEFTQTIITAFNELDNKIFERIIQQKEIDLVINVLNDLLASEYILLDKVKVDKFSTSITDNSVASNLLIESAAMKINAATIVEKIKDEVIEVSTVDRLNNIATYFTNLFTHKNLLITFFSWLILLGLIFVSLLYLGYKLYNLQIDSTIFIGAVSGIIIGAITISATIYSKRK